MLYIQMKLHHACLGIVYYSNSVTVYNTSEVHHSGNRGNSLQVRRDIEDSQRGRQNLQNWLIGDRDNGHGFENVRSRVGFKSNHISI